jgi:succinate dehydrogenase/fumarate reductase flavoprotein subunit
MGIENDWAEMARDEASFHESCDIVVAGYGFGGGVSAIEAADRGAEVRIYEKMPQPGGISICSGGGVRCAESADDAFEYLKATNAGTTPDDVLWVLAEGMADAEAYVRKLAESVPGAMMKPRDRSGKHGGNYPFPGWQTFYSAQVEVFPKLDRAKIFPMVRTRPNSGGPELFWLIDRHVKQRSIRLELNAPVVRLIRSPQNEVRGVVVKNGAGERRVQARRAVILACGGFEANPEMKINYWEGKPVLTASSRGNTGDGIRMAQAMGADLWHMWHFHGCYAFKHSDSDFPFALRV